MKKLLTMFIAMFAATVFAQTQDEMYSRLKIESVPSKGMAAISWSSDGEGFTTFERGSKGGLEVVRYEAKDNARSVIVSEDLLTDKSTGKHIGLFSFQWNKNQDKLLIYTNTVKVWRDYTKGDYWVLDMKSKELKQLGKGMTPRELMYAKFSPNGTDVAYVYKNNIYIENSETNSIKPLTKDGSKDIINGNFDWVYEEEFDCQDGFRFSNDGKWVSFWRSDANGTGKFEIINNVDSLYSFTTVFPYPKAGTTNSAVKIGSVNVENNETVWFNIEGDPRNNYIPRMEYIPGTNELIIQQMNRQQNTNHVYIGKAGESAVTKIFTDTDKAWLETNDNIQWLKDNKYFTWESERNGWRQLYTISKDGKEVEPIIKGEFDIISQVGLDHKDGYVYYLASPESPIEKYLYRTKLFGNGKAELISDAKLVGHHTYNISPNCHWAIHTFSNAVTPPQIDMLALPKNKVTRVIETNDKAKAKYESLGFIDKEFVRIPLSDITLDAYIIKPNNFDASKKYPVIVNVYSEPASSTVQNNWSVLDLDNHAIANLGYIVVSMDSRGVNLPRGREWRKCIYGQVGILAAEDQANGITKLIEMKPYMDKTRVGITGHSGGGSMTLHCMFRFPKVYKTGIAKAFVANQKYYDTIYQERYMDTPQNNPEGYKKSAPVNYTAGLEGNLLIIHGTGDDNVHYQNFEVQSNELIKQGKIFWAITYPMRTHSIREGKGTYDHLKKSTTEFWLQYLPAGGR